MKAKALQKKINANIRAHYVKKKDFEQLKAQVKSLRKAVAALEKHSAPVSPQPKANKTKAATGTAKPAEKKKTPRKPSAGQENLNRTKAAATPEKPSAPVSPQPKAGETKAVTAARPTAKKTPPRKGSAGQDNLNRIKGIGPVLEAKLRNLGITRLAQIAAWTQEDIDDISGHLDFKGRIEREEWVQQAAALVPGWK